MLSLEWLHFSPACEVFARIQVFYLGSVDEVREWLAWGSARVYLEMTPLGLPATHLRLSLGGEWAESVEGLLASHA